MLKLGIEIEFFKDGFNPSEYGINRTRWNKKELDFKNRYNICFTKEYYSGEWELNIPFTSDIRNLVKKTFTNIKRFGINLQHSIDTSIPPTGMHISIPVESLEKADKLRWKMMYYLAAVWQHINKYVNEFNRWRFLRSHHINAYFINKYADDFANRYSSINYCYGYKFGMGNKNYFPVAIKKKTINGNETYVVELRAFPIIYKEDALLTLLKKIPEFVVKNVSKRKAILTYKSIWLNTYFNI